MGFEQDPDYDYLRGLFKQVMANHNFVFDNDFDWLIKAYGPGSMVRTYIDNIIYFEFLLKTFFCHNNFKKFRMENPCNNPKT